MNSIFKKNIAKKLILIIFLLSSSIIISQESEDLISSGSSGNSWILHTPDDGIRTSMHIAPKTGGVWSWGKETVFFDNGNVKFNGNIGIGTPSPEYQLHTTAGVKIRKSTFGVTIASPENSWIRDEWLTGNYGPFKWNQSTEKWVRPSGIHNDVGGIVYQDEGTYFLREGRGTKLEYTNSEFLNTAYMFAQMNTGNVGIGTNLPDEKLHVNGTTTITADIGQVTNSHWKTGAHTLELQNSDAGDVVLAFHRAGHTNASIKHSSIGGLIFSGSGAYDQNHLFLRGNGNLGIGTTSPTELLDVQGNAEFGSGTGILKIKQGNLTFDGQERTYLFHDQGINRRIGLGITDDGSVRNFIELYEGNSPTTQYIDFGIQGNSVMRIDSNGDVGIGTADTKGYKFGVKGRIAAEEVKVQVYPWPDFVFENTYSLPTLKEVEQHINENGHLKDIPSAKEVKENGIFLGEMDSKLLQKIEELTLYTIAQQKELHSQKLINKTLEEKLELQEARLKKLEAFIDSKN